MNVLIIGLWLGVASATSVDINPKSMLRVSLADTAAEAPLIFEAVMVSTEDSVWLGPAGDSAGRRIRLAVTRMLKGEIESGFIDYWDAGGSYIHADQRLLVFGGPKVVQLTSYQPAEYSLFASLPYYEDVVVPLWDLSIVHDTAPLFAENGFEVSHLCFNGEGFTPKRTLNDEGRYCTSASWEALITHVAGLVQGSETLTMAGAVP